MASVETATITGRSRRVRRLAALVTLVSLGVAAILAGGIGLRHELSRGATKAEAAAALAAEIGSRWERLPAGTIFPATVSYQDVAGNTATATLVGIKPPAACQAALEPAAAAQIRRLRCTTMLRATYVSAGGALAATIGIAVLRSPAAAGQAERSLLPVSPGSALHTVPYPGTITAGFTDLARGAAGVQVAGPYLFLYTAGYTDTEPGSAVAAGLAAGGSGELQSLGVAILGAAENALTSHGNPCSMRDISC
ncbi:MAG TPA: hypothetical protein VMB74_07170 [Streptosporangiaceae bacterium]|nr:hypothetical protein [Streptosporangiaceae bacterium]